MQVSNAVWKATDNLVNTAQRVYDVLSHTADLSPRNPAVCYALDDLFYQTAALMENCSEAESDVLLRQFDARFLRDFRDLLNRAEEDMEYYWSSKLFAAPQAGYDSLQQFLYWKNYAALVGKEIALLRAYDAPLNAKACFVGQGPLPMTMLIYNHLTQAPSTGVDIALRATRNAQRLTAAIGCTHQCGYVHEDGCTHDYSDYEVIFIASLVPVKDRIIQKIICDRCGKTTYVVIRTAERLSRLYYDPYDGAANGLTYLGKTPYGADCINTALLYRLN